MEKENMKKIIKLYMLILNKLFMLVYKYKLSKNKVYEKTN